MSQRAHEWSIMHATLPVGDMNPVSSSTFWSAGAGLVSLSGCAAGSDAVCAVIDGVRAGWASGDRLPHPASTRTAGKTTTAARKTLRHRATLTCCMCAKWRPREFGSTRLRVLIFDVVRPPGLVAQWESVRLTRGRSLVRNQPGPQHKVTARAPISRLRAHFLEPSDGVYRAKMGPNPSALVDLPVSSSASKSRCHVVEFVVVEICVDVRGHGGRRVAHGLLQQSQIGAGPARQGGVGVPQIVHT
jgi:hypothetical protein